MQTLKNRTENKRNKEFKKKLMKQVQCKNKRKSNNELNFSLYKLKGHNSKFKQDAALKKIMNYYKSCRIKQTQNKKYSTLKDNLILKKIVYKENDNVHKIIVPFIQFSVIFIFVINFLFLCLDMTTFLFFFCLSFFFLRLLFYHFERRLNFTEEKKTSIKGNYIVLLFCVGLKYYTICNATIIGLYLHSAEVFNYKRSYF